MVESDEYVYLEGGHLGYYDLENGGVFVNRRIVYIKPDIYVLVDEFYGNTEHEYNQYFHFNNEGEVIKNSELTAKYISEKNDVDVKFVANNLNLEVIDTRYSKHYNDCIDNKTVKTTLQGDGFASIITVISTNKKGETENLEVEKLEVKSNFKEIIFEDKLIEAVNITKGDKKYTLVIAHQDYASPTDSFNADGCIGFGNVVMFNRSNGEERIGKVLMW